MLSLLLALQLAAPRVEPDPIPSTRPPNVLFVWWDDVGIADVELVPTPALDALAAEGVQLTQLRANPTCSASRLSFLYGDWRSDGFGSVLCNGYLPGVEDGAEARAVPQVFRAQGYRTALFGKWHAGAHPTASWEHGPELRGFDTWRAGVPVNVVHCLPPPLIGTYKRWLRVDDGVTSVETEYQTSAVLAAFAGWLAEVESGEERPWMSVVSFQAAHSPRHNPPASLLPPGTVVPQTERGKFEAMIQSLDAALGLLLAQVDLRETLVFVVGDNGTPGAVVLPGQLVTNAKAYCGEIGIRVPAVVAGPGIVRGSTNSQLMHVADLGPTLLGLAGLPQPLWRPRDFRGKDLSPGIQHGFAVERGHVFVANDPTDDKAVLVWPYKLRVFEGVEMLFNLQSDPDERMDLVADPAHADVLQELRPLVRFP